MFTISGKRYSPCCSPKPDLESISCLVRCITILSMEIAKRERERENESLHFLLIINHSILVIFNDCASRELIRPNLLRQHS